MATKIEWTDEVWNPVTGCTKISEGCQNCYAKRMVARFWGARPFTDVRVHAERLEQPLHWRKSRRIFVCSMGDLFHEAVPFEFIDKVVAIFDKCPQHIGQLLTKRAKRMYEYSCSRYCMWPENIIGMVTAENQKRADERIPRLLQCGFKTTGVSIEPMLEEIGISEFLIGDICGSCGAEASEIYVHQGDHWISGPEPNLGEPCGPIVKGGGLDWVIIGCESGPKRRLCKIEWVRSLIQQCKAVSIPVFVKQLSINGKVSHDPDEWPEDLRLRQMPQANPRGRTL